MKEEAARALRGLLEHMGMEGVVEAREDEERITLEIQGRDAGLIIGRQGATLDALQYLVNRMVAHGQEDAERKPITLDAEGYRGRRVESLVEMAHRLADKARKTGRPVAAQPMSAADRRVMHLALADVSDVTTRSEGEGSERHLIIVPLGVGGRAERAGGGRAE
ncbi:MAG TPA: R3H domain-containing nucleic acid-binding protein [Polyangia bacterium]|jgi:spoIIIJ-associated protein|nr:R3H domain-containing nucleic acid-binding protein [Polyangia bacterium]